MSQLLLLLVFASSHGGKITKKLSYLSSFKANFWESISYSSVTSGGTWSGVVSLQKPDKLRMEVYEPDSQLIVSDGKTAWLYIKKRNEAYKRNVLSLVKQVSPSYIFLDTSKFTVKLDSLTPQHAHFTLKPREKDESLSLVDKIRLVVELEDTLPVEVLIKDVENNVFDFNFENPAADVKLEDTLFKFTPSKNCKVIEDAF